jgi:hypothetical protein
LDAYNFGHDSIQMEASRKDFFLKSFLKSFLDIPYPKV